MTYKEKLRLYQLDLASERVKTKLLRERVHVLTYYLKKYRDSLKSLRETINL